MTVNSTVVATLKGVTGDVAHSRPLAIGGKTDCDGTKVQCDPYVGVIDRVDIDRPS